MTQVIHSVEPFKTINGKLSNGWACFLIAEIESGVRLQMCSSDAKDGEWRHCIEAANLDKAIDKAVSLSKLITPAKFSKMTHLHCKGHVRSEGHK